MFQKGNQITKGMKFPNRKKAPPRTQETKDKIKKSMNGHSVSEKTRKKIGLANLGKIRSDETKNKLSESHKGHSAWNKGIKKRINTGRTHFKKGMIPWNKGKKNTFKHTDEAKRRISESESGEKHYNWQGGIANEPYSVDWTKTLKRAIKERDKFTCRICEEQDDLVIHHIDYDKKNCNSDNLITLCRKCHTRTNTHRDYWTNYFQNKLK